MFNGLMNMIDHVVETEKVDKKQLQSKEVAGGMFGLKIQKQELSRKAVGDGRCRIWAPFLQCHGSAPPQLYGAALVFSILERGMPCPQRLSSLARSRSCPVTEL